MKLPNDEIVHYKSDNGVTCIIERTELVRCKDCKWYRYHNKQCVKNGHHGTKLDDYCSYGERKEKGKC